MDTKPGVKTTEFWVTLVVSLLNGVIASGLFVDGSLVLRLATAIVSGLTALGYILSRAQVKVAATKGAQP